MPVKKIFIQFKIFSCFVFYCFLLLTTGCATTGMSSSNNIGGNFKSNLLKNMAIASVIGYGIGQSRDQNKDPNSVLYAGLLASVAAVGTTLSEDPDAQIDQLRRQNQELSKAVGFGNSVQPTNSVQSTTAPMLGIATALPTDMLHQSSFTSPSIRGFERLPEKYKSLVSPGEWKLYQINEWERLDEYHLVHKTEILELIPPSLKGN